ncbi:imidazolonepropionase [Croceiramulus getboli]|nr:imidazolonepropionase [Flavobacteriaceae bacterium YJPT1-3]
MENTFVIGPISQCLPMTNLPGRGALRDEQLPIIEQAGIRVDQGKVIEVGHFDPLSAFAKANQLPLHQLERPYVALPGWVDAHTHLCFGGSRARDYALRNSGKSYLEIAKAGGGIWDTVTQTRATSKAQLTEDFINRLKRCQHLGVTTVEVKSGYGLNVEEELKLLEAIQAGAERSASKVVSSCLAAHLMPKDFLESPEAYLKMISQELFPILKSRNLADRIDAFVEESAFSAEQIRPYFAEAIKLGFDLTVHADQFTTGGSALAVEMGARSADHLEASTAKEIALLAKSNTVAVALPGASLGLGCGYTPARALLDAGAALAIASDWNPGSAPMGHLLLQAAVLGAAEKLSNAEVLAGISCRAADALGLETAGRIQAGAAADFLLFPTDDYREITYHQGQLLPDYVFIDGQAVKQPNHEL